MQENTIMQMPFSLEAEQSVLGSVLIEPACLPEVASILKAEDFYVEQNREIYEIMCGMFNESETIDIVTLLERMRTAGVHDEAGGKAYLVSMAEFVPSTANVVKYARIVEEKAYLRRLIEASREIADSCFEAADEVSNIIDSAEQKIYEITQRRVAHSFRDIQEVIVSTYDRLHGLSGDNRDDYLGMPTYYQTVDRLMTGMGKSDLIFIAGRPGMGKTSFALNVARNVAVKSKKAVAIFSLEMSSEQIVSSMLSTEAMVDSVKLRSGELSGEDWVNLARAASTLASCRIRIDDSTGITVTEMKAKLRREKDLGLVIIDYLQLMTSGKKSDSRVNEVSEITRSLKILAKELNVPVLTCCQLSRGPESRGDHTPMLSDLRESGSIEQDADMVLFIYREDYYKPETDRRNIAELIVAKNRHGSVGKAELAWLGQYTKFSDMEKIHHEP